MIQTVREQILSFKTAYVGLNALYFGLIVVGMVYGKLNPSLSQSLWEQVESAFEEGAFSSIPSMASKGQVLELFLTIFLVNLILGSLVVITLPSLVIPFAGLLSGSYRAFLWGLLAPIPSQPNLGVVLQALPLIVLVMLEGEGYVLAMLAAYVHWRGILLPRSIGVATRWQAYKRGLGGTLGIYGLVCLVLALAAAYEVAFTELLRLDLISLPSP